MEKRGCPGKEGSDHPSSRPRAPPWNQRVNSVPGEAPEETTPPRRFAGRGKKPSGSLSQPHSPHVSTSPGRGLRGSRTGLRTQTNSGQEDQMDLAQVPTPIRLGCPEHCAEDGSESRPEPMSTTLGAGLCHRRGGGAPVPGVNHAHPRFRALRNQRAMWVGHLLFQGTWAHSSLIRSWESLFRYRLRAWLSPPASSPP